MNTKYSDCTVSDYSYKNCLFWGVAKAHFIRISTNWKSAKYDMVFKHLALGLLEAVPIIGQIISFAERRFCLISVESKISTQIFQSPLFTVVATTKNAADLESREKNISKDRDNSEQPKLQENTATLLISSQNSVERDKARSKPSGLTEETMAKVMADEEDRSSKVAADPIPDEMRKVAENTTLTKTIDPSKSKQEKILNQIEPQEFISESHKKLDAQITEKFTEILKRSQEVFIANSTPYTGKESEGSDIDKLSEEIDGLFKFFFEYTKKMDLDTTEKLTLIYRDKTRICYQIKNSLLCLRAINKIQFIAENFNESEFFKIITKNECHALSYLVCFDAINNKNSGLSLHKSARDISEQAVFNYFDSVVKIQKTYKEVFLNIEESVKSVLNQDFFKTHSFKWLSGSSSSIFFGLKLLENNNERAALVPSGQLMEKFSFRPLSGEMQGCGINRNHLSGMSMEGVDVCLSYAESYKFDQTLEEDKVFKFLQNIETDHSYYLTDQDVFRIKTAIYRIIFVNSENIDKIKKRFASLEKPKLNAKTCTLVDEILEIFDTKPTSPKLEKEDLELLKNPFPIIWGSSSITERICRLRKGVAGEIVVQGEAVLEQDIQVAFTNEKNRTTLMDKLKNKNIKVFRLETAALLAAAYSERPQQYMDRVITERYKFI